MEQIIYFGAPGTGKSYQIDKELKEKHVEDEYIFRVTFHPDFSYSDFIGQLIPVTKYDENNNEIITYSFSKGVFTQALEKAYEDTSKNVYLVIEEMSRGNCASIFGDIFQLLDREVQGIDRGYSRYFINNEMISKDIIAIQNGRVKLPPNLYIYGTVNTSDQNVYVMDNAFKRRFNWKYIDIKPIGNPYLNNVDIPLSYGVNGNYISWVVLYLTLDKFISSKEYLDLGEDKQIGQFFIEFASSNESDIKELIKNKLLYYLWFDINQSSYKTNVSLFADDISSFSDLYDKYELNQEIFSERFNSLLSNQN